MIPEICELLETQVFCVLFVEAISGGLAICLAIIAIGFLWRRFIRRKK